MVKDFFARAKARQDFAYDKRTGHIAAHSGLVGRMGDVYANMTAQDNEDHTHETWRYRQSEYCAAYRDARDRDALPFEIAEWDAEDHAVNRRLQGH